MPGPTQRTPRATRRDGGASSGASSLEYALLIAAVAAVLVAVLLGLGSIVKDAIDHTNDCVSSHGSSTSCATR
jgi:pilus assembly protein Flp/PilA